MCLPLVLSLGFELRKSTLAFLEVPKRFRVLLNSWEGSFLRSKSLHSKNMPHETPRKNTHSLVSLSFPDALQPHSEVKREWSFTAVFRVKSRNELIKVVLLNPADRLLVPACARIVQQGIGEGSALHFDAAFRVLKSISKAKSLNFECSTPKVLGKKWTQLAYGERMDLFRGNVQVEDAPEEYAEMIFLSPPLAQGKGRRAKKGLAFGTDAIEFASASQVEGLQSRDEWDVLFKHLRAKNASAPKQASKKQAAEENSERKIADLENKIAKLEETLENIRSAYVAAVRLSLRDNLAAKEYAAQLRSLGVPVKEYKSQGDS
jgi:hypothetical protein